MLISEAVGKIIGLVLAHSVLIGSDLQEGELLVPVSYTHLTLPTIYSV